MAGISRGVEHRASNPAVARDQPGPASMGGGTGRTIFPENNPCAGRRFCVLVSCMNQNPRSHTQDLREAFSSIISMILGLLRAHGLRGLVYLPEVWLATRELKRIGEAFCELFAAWGAGLLPATPSPAPQQRHA